MTGSGEGWLSDGLDAPGADSGLWVSGVDYIGGWREARETADRLNRALLGLGFEVPAVRAVASTNEDGRGVVRLTGWPGAVEHLARLLETCPDRDGGAS
ncbi:hypothetical protein [Streptomyces cadmiisoli]|uniref:Uncharacterized protein n=1 Tax=Streptomyces cadmiisoli TaxID=2184053 RepID=A0A2Z4JBK7_9ACTN|nr:hypothetical protein [Streptomyces cadmiisoli]AWW42479.1 hypothetical protein DN051_15555 [Streptomyces cadmiisoli]